MRIFLAGLAIAAGMASGAAACPTYSLSGASYSLTGDQLYAPQSLQVIAGGENNLANCSAPGVGYVATAPDFTFYLSGMDPYYLVLDVDSACDATLLVNTADAQWHFDDDSNGNLDPRLELRGSTALNGRVDVWVGSYNGQYCNATLNMETFRGTGGQTGTVTPGMSLAGTWQWEAIGRPITIYANGTASDGVNSATWTGPDPSGRYVISWSHGYTDFATLSADGNRMDLVNNNGYHFSATRQPPNLGGDVIFPSNPLIRVLSATYGANCGAPQGNVTAHIAAQCNGQSQCNYRVDYTVIGDPAVGCGKDYDVSYDCGDGVVRRAHAGAEAGYGSIVALQCAASPSPTPTPTPAPMPYFELVLVPEGISFDAARQRAAAMGGHLATITNPAELQAAWQAANNPAAWHVDDYGNSIGPWLGGLRGSVAGQPGQDWVWITGEPWVYTAWAPGEPNNSGGGETHLHFFAQGRQAGPTWNDISPNHPVRGFIVEYGSGSSGGGQPAVPVGTIAGSWHVNANGFTGTLFFTQSGFGWSATLNLGHDEVLQNVIFEPATGRVEFLRPIPGLDQHYVGTLSGGQLSGQFNQTAGSPYSYNWSATR